jgi:hypothetical protein
MQLHLDARTGTIPASYPKTWFRVSDWITGRFIADFTTKAEAYECSFSSNTGKRYNDKVSTMRLSGASE